LKDSLKAAAIGGISSFAAGKIGNTFEAGPKTAQNKWRLKQRLTPPFLAANLETS
jgi:hypothetical protein